MIPSEEDIEHVTTEELAKRLRDEAPDWSICDSGEDWVDVKFHKEDKVTRLIILAD